jgi:putative hydrolase of the HAD superfamily
VEAVVLDLFGTVVDAPSPRQRTHAASRLAALLGCGAATVEDYFRGTWHVRHDGHLPTLVDLATHLVNTVNGPDTMVEPIADELLALGQVRVVPSPSVIHALASLSDNRVRLGILSDASAEIVAAWPRSPLAALVGAAVFSCTAGAIKPDQRLYRAIGNMLDVPPHQTLYVGDGGGDELRGALTAGMAAIAVRRRGTSDSLVFNEADCPGPSLDAVENVPAYLRERA